MSTLGPPPALSVEAGEVSEVEAVGEVGVVESTAAELEVSVALALDEESDTSAVNADAGDAARRHSAMDKSPLAHTDHQ
jgi:hypothetical protein